MGIEEFREYCQKNESRKRTRGSGGHKNLVERVYRNPEDINRNPDEKWKEVMLKGKNGCVGIPDLIFLEERQFYVIECKARHWGKSNTQLRTSYEFIYENFGISPLLLKVKPSGKSLNGQYVTPKRN